ncbi:winged helix-turn-helix domain-containing protein [Enterobacter cloacae]
MMDIIGKKLMHTTYLIGSLLEINHQSKALIHRGNKNKASLPTSGCFCLQALAERSGNTLSLTELMEIGWGQTGVTVTENSIRVMINKIRKAITSLGMQRDIILLTVPRSGYKLLVNNTLQPGLLPGTGKNTDKVTASMESATSMASIVVGRDRFNWSVFSSDMLTSKLKHISGRMVVLGCSLLVMISIACTNWTIMSSFNYKNGMQNDEWSLPLQETDTKASHLFAGYYLPPVVTLFRWISDNSPLDKLKNNVTNIICSVW